MTIEGDLSCGFKGECSFLAVALRRESLARVGTAVVERVGVLLGVY